MTPRTPISEGPGPGLRWPRASSTTPSRLPQGLELNPYYVDVRNDLGTRARPLRRARGGQDGVPRRVQRPHEPHARDLRPQPRPGLPRGEELRRGHQLVPHEPQPEQGLPRRLPRPRRRAHRRSAARTRRCGPLEAGAQGAARDPRRCFSPWARPTSSAGPLHGRADPARRRRRRKDPTGAAAAARPSCSRTAPEGTASRSALPKSHCSTSACSTSCSGPSGAQAALLLDAQRRAGGGSGDARRPAPPRSAAYQGIAPRQRQRAGRCGGAAAVTMHGLPLRLGT